MLKVPYTTDREQGQFRNDNYALAVLANKETGVYSVHAIRKRKPTRIKVQSFIHCESEGDCADGAVGAVFGGEEMEERVEGAGPAPIPEWWHLAHLRTPTHLRVLYHHWRIWATGMNMTSIVGIPIPLPIASQKPAFIP